MTADEVVGLVFGIRSRPLSVLAPQVEGALGISLEEREGLHAGGVYYRGALRSGESVSLYDNFNAYERIRRAPRHQRYGQLVYVWGSDDARIAKKLLESVPGLKLLYESRKERRARRWVNVVDVATTSFRGGPPRGQMHDIVEIAVTELDLDDLALVATTSILVRSDQVESPSPDVAISLEDAFARLRAVHDTRRRIFASYGSSVRGAFEQTCGRHHIALPFGAERQDVRTLVRASYGDKDLREALVVLGLPPEGDLSHVADSSRAVARVLRAMLLKLRR